MGDGMLERTHRAIFKTSSLSCSAAPSLCLLFSFWPLSKLPRLATIYAFPFGLSIYAFPFNRSIVYASCLAAPSLPFD